MASKPWPIYASSSKAFYIESLDQVNRAAYKDKLTVIDGLDPYTVSKDDLVYEVEALPKITHLDIINCLVFSPSRFTMEDMKDCKSLEAYDMFFRGWVRDLGVIQAKEDTCVLRALVLSSEELGTTTLCPWVIVRRDGTVLVAHCDCIDGLNEVCSHVAALLFTAEANVRALETGTVDDEEARWMMPSAEEKLLFRPISEIDFIAERAHTRNQLVANSKENPESDSELCNDASLSRNIPPPTEAEMNELYKALHASGAKCALLSLIKPYSHEYVPKVQQGTSDVPVTSANPPAVDCAEEPVSSQGNVWCVCRGEESGRMIACDHQGCSVEWFHYACVGIKRKPKGSWFCPECTVKRCLQ